MGAEPLRRPREPRRDRLPARAATSVVHRRVPRGRSSIAEESTAWPGVSRPTYVGGLGFGFKWNMGWMHDTLDYFARDPVHRRFHHHELTFALLYASTENFVLPLSHDEVVHGKGSLLAKMPATAWQKFANLRALYGYMWAHPGKKLLFMGGEFGAGGEWNHDALLDWHLLDAPEHAGVQALVRDLNHIYREEPALWSSTTIPRASGGSSPTTPTATRFSFVRASPEATRASLVCVANLNACTRAGVPNRPAARWALARGAEHRHPRYGGSDVGNGGPIEADPVPWHGQPCSAEVALPPLGVVWLVPGVSDAAAPVRAPLGATPTAGRRRRVPRLGAARADRRGAGRRRRPRPEGRRPRCARGVGAHGGGADYWFVLDGAARCRTPGRAGSPRASADRRACSTRRAFGWRGHRPAPRRSTELVRLRAARRDVHRSGHLRRR